MNPTMLEYYNIKQANSSPNWSCGFSSGVNRKMVKTDITTPPYYLFQYSFQDTTQEELIS